jgi:hypothetical protein
MRSETRRLALFMQSCCSATETGAILWEGSTRELPGSRAGAAESVRKRHLSLSNRSKRARLNDFKMKAFILHDDPILATRVKATLRRAIQRAEATALWTITLRPISALRQPTTARQVLAAAVGAHLVVFASCHPESLSLWAYEWLERWAVSRRVRDAALVLTDGGCGTELTDATSELSQLARKHQLTLLVSENSTVVKPPNVSIRGAAEERSPVAVVQPPFLDTPTNHSYRGWGINE